ncbi:sugar ABC transporter substrate-binding protein [Butyrivibrio sp. MC2013]|uniref:sugar ABC transporter substrate-binding protein n=1 Tax=Butyrivibrio sp. MC2013 TaxID=1280686 RepID=UPI00041B10E2|nr:sugar ABC transporter substrate-binding protein [Butyrivibrio sp. MC2013]
MKKLIALVLTGVILLTGCAKGGGGKAFNVPEGEVQADSAYYSKADLNSLKDKKIGITIQSLDNAYWAGVMGGLEEVLTKYQANYKLVACDQNVDTQIGQIENFITDNYDFILVHAADKNAIEDLCGQARSKGIKVMCWDDTMTNSDVNWILDNMSLGIEIGKLAGDFINEHYDASNKAKVCFIGYDALEVLLDRGNGIKKGMEDVAGGKFEIVAEVDGLNPDQAQAAMDQVLKETPDCNIAVGIGSGAMIGANESYMNFYNSQIPEEVGVITTDVTKRQLNAILSDEACRGIIGFEGSDVDTGNAAAAMIALVLADQQGSHNVFRGFSPITADNVNAILSNMK